MVCFRCGIIIVNVPRTVILHVPRCTSFTQDYVLLQKFTVALFYFKDELMSPFQCNFVAGTWELLLVIYIYVFYLS